MEESPEKLLKSIGKLEGQLASGGDALTQVKLGEMRKQFRRKTGKDAPSIKLQIPTLKAGKMPSIHIGDINISGEGHAIAPGGFAVLNQATSRMLSDSLARTGGNAKLVMEANDLKGIFPSPEALFAATAEAPLDPTSPSGRPVTSYPSHVCRVECHDADGNLTSKGTGFLVAPRLVLTCRHVLEDLNKLHSVTFRFAGPLQKGLPTNPDVIYSHTLHAKASKRGGRPDLWIDSPPFLSADDFEAGNRDLALLEIDRNTERWGVFVEAGPKLAYVALAEVLAHVVEPTDPLRPYANAVINSEDSQDIDLLRPAFPGGESRSRGRTDSSGILSTHDVSDTERGDSGSPLVSPGSGTVGMHTSKGESENGGKPKGRFVHVSYIQEAIRKNQQLASSGHRESLGRHGWIPKS